MMMNPRNPRKMRRLLKFNPLKLKLVALVFPNPNSKQFLATATQHSRHVTLLVVAFGNQMTQGHLPLKQIRETVKF